MSEIKTVATRVIVDKVNSETNKTKHYYVTTHVTCSCPGGTLAGGCKHIDAKLASYTS